jgi:3-hydroxyisobutyrate dehydrogenase/2-hydroxy-3-oxopropionate reductase
MSTVAVVGLGAMGSRIARRLLDAGHEVVVWNRSPEKQRALLEAGATAADSPAGAAGRSDTVITMVSDPAALRAVTEGPAGVAAGVDPASTVVEMSTVGPAAVLRLASLLPAGAGILDAPVLGSVAEVEQGTLRIFVGGAQPVVECCGPLLSTLGSTMHVGPLGSGATAKLVANASLFGALTLVGEVLSLASSLGLSRDAAFDVMATTPLAAQAERRRPAIEANDYPPRFSLALARKDADLIDTETRQHDLDLRLVDAARSWFVDAERTGWAGRDYSAVLALIMGTG